MIKLEFNHDIVGKSKMVKVGFIVAVFSIFSLMGFSIITNNNGINSHILVIAQEDGTDDDGGGSEESSSQGTAVVETIAQRGTVSSSQDPLNGHESHQAAVILPPRDDGGLYSGVLTYTATQPVEIAVVQVYDLDNETTQQISDQFGSIFTSPAPWSEGETVTPLMMSVDYANSPTISSTTPFVGNVLALHTSSGEPFIATYSVVADVYQPEVVSNVESALNITS